MYGEGGLSPSSRIAPSFQIHALTLVFANLSVKRILKVYSATHMHMDEDELQAHRKERLKKWLEEHGGAAFVIGKMGLPQKLAQSTMSYLSQLKSGYSFGARSARTIEVKLGMARGHLDDVGNQKLLDKLSPTAIELGGMFDRATKGLDRDARETVYAQAVTAIRNQSRSERRVDPDELEPTQNALRTRKQPQPHRPKTQRV